MRRACEIDRGLALTIRSNVPLCAERGGVPSNQVLPKFRTSRTTALVEQLQSIDIGVKVQVRS